MELFEYAYTDNYSNFNEWLELASNEENVYPFNRVPYEEWLQKYINNIEEKDEEEVKRLLRVLLKPYTRHCDTEYFEGSYALIQTQDNLDETNNISELIKKHKEKFNSIEMYRRIEHGNEAWEGLTWILQLLPFQPFKAIRALNAYLDSELSTMPDDRILGINQCIDIIEEKYISHSNKDKESIITKLKPREFEWLIELLYQHLGFETILTPATRDGGKDIIASIIREDGREKVYVECKLYKTTKLKKESVRALYGALSKDNTNRGVMYCTGYVSNEIRNTDERIQIISLEETVVLLNAHLGSDWDKRLDILIENQRRKYKK